MAYQRYTIDGFGQVELNNVAFRRDGRIEAQCALDATAFANGPAENGMVLAVDKVKGVVRFVGASEKLPIAINYSAEHMYDEREVGLKDFKLEVGGILPRMGYLAIGDLFTTNCIGYDTAAFANDAAVVTAAEAVKTTPMYAAPAADGSWQMLASAPSSGCVAEVVKAFSMPDGQFAVQLRVIAL